MTEEVKQEFPPIIDGTYKKDDPHKDIGKQKFRVKTYYSSWVEYDVIADSKEEAENAVIEHGGIDKIKYQEGYHRGDPVEVYASNWNYDDYDQTQKVEECVPYEDNDIDTGEYFENFEDPEWTSDEFRWNKVGEVNG